MDTPRWFVLQALAVPFDEFLVPLGFRRVAGILQDADGAGLAWVSPHLRVHVYVEPVAHRGDVRIIHPRSRGHPQEPPILSEVGLDEILRERGLLPLDHRVEGGARAGGDTLIHEWASAAAGRLSLVSDLLRGEGLEAVDLLDVRRQTPGPPGRDVAEPSARTGGRG